VRHTLPNNVGQNRSKYTNIRQLLPIFCRLSCIFRVFSAKNAEGKRTLMSIRITGEHVLCSRKTSGLYKMAAVSVESPGHLSRTRTTQKNVRLQ
jgi:hypothetical protein